MLIVAVNVKDVLTGLSTAGSFDRATSSSLCFVRRCVSSRRAILARGGASRRDKHAPSLTKGYTDKERKNVEPSRAGVRPMGLHIDVAARRS
ncbi:hypothetical protein GCM10010994_38750 [Chelatococcus reniformis]|uniref:Uncharacterized protein n=1 Tax=Chelatococcus reniformis TaxID=1494448 RepID=A0A916UMV0_9HYPH|nr:hypothetical protein GCM10010994_38750 [Chelatococcus reniformis]